LGVWNGVRIHNPNSINQWVVEVVARVKGLEEHCQHIQMVEASMMGWRVFFDTLLDWKAHILCSHQGEIDDMKVVLEVQTLTIMAQSALITNLSDQVQNLQRAVDPVGQFTDYPIVVEDDSDCEEEQLVEIEEVTWIRGYSVPNVHTLYMIKD
jgi:hypothetical protein